MIFDDLFYPGNPEKRQKVSNLRGEIIISFKNFKNAWNENAEMLNKIFVEQPQGSKYSTISLKKIEKDIEKDEIKACTDEINDVVSDTKKILDKLVKDIGLEEILPTDWMKKGITIKDIGNEKAKKIGQAISGTISTALAAYVGYYVFQGVTVAVALVSAIAGITTSLLAIAGGAIAGAVLGGVAFVITDIIASAITGALERKELNEAIDTLTEIKDNVAIPLQDATRKISGVTQSIKDGTYLLDQEHLLVKFPDGSYHIMELKANAAVAFSTEDNSVMFIPA